MSTSRIARTNLALGLLSLLLLPLSAFGTRLGLFPFRIGMLLFLASALLAMVVIVIAALRTRAQPNEASRRLLSRSSLLALPAVASFGFTLFAGGDAPMIHNVTTAPDDPPTFIAAPEQRGPDANPLDYDAETAQLQKAAYPELTTLISPLPPEAAFERALELNPHYTEAALNLSVIYNELGEYVKAREVYEQARGTGEGGALDRLDSFARGKIANLHRDLGDAYASVHLPDHAVREYKKALAVCPTFVDIRTKLANTLRDMGRTSDALDEYEGIVEVSPGYAPARIHFGVTLWRDGRITEARTQWEEALRLDPDNRSCRVYLGMTERELAKGDTEGDAEGDADAGDDAADT